MKIKENLIVIGYMFTPFLVFILVPLAQFWVLGWLLGAF
jgi:hypothetical protein